MVSDRIKISVLVVIALLLLVLMLNGNMVGFPNSESGLTAITGAVTLGGNEDCGTTITEDAVLDSDITNCEGNGIIIDADDITLDCDGYAIEGTGNYVGIYGEQLSGVTIKDCDVDSFETGIKFENSRDLTLRGNTLRYHGGETGIRLNYVNDSYIVDNTIYDNDVGVRIDYSNRNRFRNNDISGHYYQGIYLYHSNNNNITGGEIYDNNQGEYSDSGGILMSYSENNSVYSVYLHDNKYSAVYINGIENSYNNNRIESNNIDSNCGGQAGVYISGSDYTTLKNNNITNGTGYGIEMYDSTGAEIMYNNISENSNYGIYIDGSNWDSDHQIIGNYLVDNTDGGIYIYNENDDEIKNNYVKCSDITNDYGIYINAADDFVLSGNEITNCYYGLYLENIYDMTINEEIYGNVYGIYMNPNNEYSKITDSDIHHNCIGVYSSSGTFEVIDTDFEYNRNFDLNQDDDCWDQLGGEPTGGIVSEGATIDVINGNFINNGDNEGWAEDPFGIYDEEDKTVTWYVSEPVDCTNNNIYLFGEVIGYPNINRNNCQIYVDDDEVSFCGGSYGACSCGDRVVDDYTFEDDLYCDGDGLMVVNSDITIDCNQYEIEGGGGDDGIMIDRATGITIKNCKINNFDRGVEIRDSDDITFEENHFWDNDRAVDSRQTSNFVFEDNKFNGNSHAFYGGSEEDEDEEIKENFVFSYNIIDDHSNEAIYFDEHYYNGVFMHNNFTNNDYDYYCNDYCSDMAFKHNWFENSSNSIYGENYQNRYTIQNNDFYYFDEYGIYLSYSVYHSDISDNTFMGEPSEAYPIYIEHGGHINITDNDIYDTENGVYTEYVNHVIFRDNYIDGIPDTGDCAFYFGYDYDLIMDDNEFYDTGCPYYGQYQQAALIRDTYSDDSEYGLYIESDFPLYKANTEVAYDYIAVNSSTADWHDSDDNENEDGLDLPFVYTYNGVDFTRFSITSNGYVELVQETGDSCYQCSDYDPKYELTTDDYGDEGLDDFIVIFGMMDDLDSESYGEYGYKHFEAGDLDAEGNPVSEEMIVFYWITETHGDNNGDNNEGQMNEFQVVVYPNGNIRWNFKQIDAWYCDYDMYTGVYLGPTRKDIAIGSWLPEETSYLFIPGTETMDQTRIYDNTVTDVDGSTGYSYAALYIEDIGEYITIHNNTFSDSNIGISFYVGSEGEHISNIDILDNEIEDNNVGIYLYDDSESIINTTISKNSISDNNCVGLYSYDGEGLVVNDNGINNNNENSGICSSINMGTLGSSSGPGGDSDNETLSVNNGGGAYDGDEIAGIYLEEEDDAEVSDNLLMYNCEGIFMEDSTARISNNDFEYNNDDYSDCIMTGLYVGDGSQATLRNNNFIGNGEYAVYDSESDSVYWSLTEDVNCTDNDIIMNGWITPFGGRINAHNCTIWVNGNEMNFSGKQQGQAEFSADTSGDNEDTVGNSSYGVSAEIHTGTAYSNDITFDFYDENPGTSGFALSDMGRYVNVTPQGDINLSYWILKIYYLDEELEASGIIESTLRIQYYNETSHQWVVYNPPDGGVNTTENYAWARLNHFSLFGLFGSTPTGGGGGGSGSSYHYTRDLGQLGADPVEFDLRRNYEYKLKFNGVDYLIRLMSIQGGVAKIAFDGTLVMLGNGQTGYIDIDEDGTDDLKISADFLSGSLVKVTLEAIVPVLAAPDQPVSEPTEAPLVRLLPGETEEAEERAEPRAPARPAASCYDNILNQGEEDVDCGGPCAPCKKFPIGTIIVTLALVLVAIGVFVGARRWPEIQAKTGLFHKDMGHLLDKAHIALEHHDLEIAMREYTKIHSMYYKLSDADKERYRDAILDLHKRLDLQHKTHKHMAG